MVIIIKKLLIIVISIFLLLGLAGCSKSATSVVEDYLNKYNSLDEQVVKNIDSVIEEENLTKEQKEVYRSVFKKQYADLNYKITDEKYNGDDAVITVKVNVYDLHAAQMKAVKKLANEPDIFNNEDGLYDVTKYISYKLDLMKDQNDKVEYSIDFYVKKDKNGWNVVELGKEDLEKLHGIYDYD